MFKGIILTDIIFYEISLAEVHAAHTDNQLFYLSNISLMSFLDHQVSLNLLHMVTEGINPLYI